MAIDNGFGSYSWIKISKLITRQTPDMVFLKFYTDWAIRMPLKTFKF